MHSEMMSPVPDRDSTSANRHVGTATGKSGDRDSTAKLASEIIRKRALSHNSLSKLRENLMHSCSGRPGPDLSYATVSSIFLPVPPPLNSSAPTMRLTPLRSEEHTSELQSLMRISYAVFCLNKKNN